MLKISSVQVKQALSEASETLRKLASENTELNEKLAFYTKKERCEKIASLMQDRGVKVEQTFEEKVAELMETSTSLEVIEEAVRMEPKNMKLASLEEGGKSLSLDPFSSLVASLSDLH
jgi:hypothetical protein